MTNGSKAMRPDHSLGVQAAQSVLWNLLLVPVRYVMPLVSSVVVVRVLGADNYGFLASLLAIIQTITLWADLGLSKSVPKFEAEIREHYHEEALNDFLVTLVVLHVILFALAAVGIVLLSETVLQLFNIEEHKRTYLALIVVLLILDAPTGILRGILVSRFGNKQINLIDLLGTVLRPVLYIAAALADTGVVGILSTNVIVSVVVLVVSILATRSMLRWRCPSIGRVMELGRMVGCRFAVYSSFTYLVLAFKYFTSSMFMILLMNVFALQSQVAYFKIASTAANTMRGLASMPLSYTIAAILGRTFVDKDHNRLRKAYETMGRILLLCMVPLSLGLAIIAYPAVRISFGVECVPAARSLQLLVMFQMIGTIFPYSGSILHMYERYGYLLITGLISIAVTIVTSILLVPRLGHVGAAVSSGLGGIAFSLSATVVVHRLYDFRYPVDFAVRILISCLPMAVYFLRPEAIGRTGYHLTGYVAYAIISFWMLFRLQGGVHTTDRELLKRAGVPRVHAILRFI